MNRIYKAGFAAWVAILLLFGCGSDSKVDGIGTKDLTLSLVLTDYVYSTGRGTNIARFAVHAVDESGKYHSNLPIRVSLVNVADSTCFVQGYHGTLHTTDPRTFSDYTLDFSKTSAKPGDTLIILPTLSRQGSSYLGDWKIGKVGNNLELTPEPAYNVETTDELAYVIGDEKCLFLGRWFTNVHVQSPEDAVPPGKTLEADKGLTYFDVVYDDILIGNWIAIGVHIEGVRAGTSGLFVLPVPTVSVENNSNN